MTEGHVSRTLRIGTRGSALALAQTETVAELLRASGSTVEIVRVKTPGDVSDAPIAQIGIGVFTSALREALAADEVDLAVHSYKDLPTAPDPRLSLAAVPPRADPRDVLVARDGFRLAELPPGATIGTGSPRRAAQLEALGLGFEVRGVRGNVGTRIGKVRSGALDAVVLALAGLDRLGLRHEASEVLDPLQMLPAPAQGALAVECRVDDLDAEHLVRSVADDPGTRAAALAERSMLAAIEGGCHAPVGALAEVVEDIESVDLGAGNNTDENGTERVVLRLSLRGVAASPTGELLRASIAGDLTAAEDLGRALASELLDLGAAKLAGPEQY